MEGMVPFLERSERGDEMKDKDFEGYEENIHHEIAIAGASNEPSFVEYKLRVAQIKAILLLARVLQERPHAGR